MIRQVQGIWTLYRIIWTWFRNCGLRSRNLDFVQKYWTSGFWLLDFWTLNKSNSDFWKSNLDFWLLDYGLWTLDWGLTIDTDQCTIRDNTDPKPFRRFHSIRTLQINLIDLRLQFIFCNLLVAHWGTKWRPKCFQNVSKSKLDFYVDFCFVFSRLSVPKRVYFRDENRIFSLKV